MYILPSELYGLGTVTTSHGGASLESLRLLSRLDYAFLAASSPIRLLSPYFLHLSYLVSV